MRLFKYATTSPTSSEAEVQRQRIRNGFILIPEVAFEQHGFRPIFDQRRYWDTLST